MNKFKTVSVIEDNQASVFWIKEIMEEVQFAENVLVYYNGKAALEELSVLILNEETIPDIIFLDLNMPVMDGWEFLDEFIKIEPVRKILIYILTSSVDPEDTVRAKKYDNVSSYIVKPITDTILRKLLQES